MADSRPEMAFLCPNCGAGIDRNCMSRSGKMRLESHRERKIAAQFQELKNARTSLMPLRTLPQSWSGESRQFGI